MKVMAEIAGATAMPEEILVEKIREFEKKGADIIDLGATMDCNVDDVIRSVKITKATSRESISY
jgi:aspartate/glutamate racemase